jgi:hypothetical protein
MVYIVDINMSRSDELKTILEKSHTVVLTDDFFVESLKGTDPKKMFHSNTRLFADHINSLYVSFDRGPLYRQELINGKPLSKEEIIDYSSTAIIKDIILDINKYDCVSKHFITEAKNRVAYQKAFTEKYLLNASGFLKKIFANTNCRKEYNSNRSQLLSEIKETTLQVVEMILKEANINSEPFMSSNSVIYANTYILLWRVVHWTLKNGIENVHLDKLAHDGFDLKYVLVSSFFDGILTEEEWLKQCRMDLLNSFIE